MATTTSTSTTPQSNEPYKRVYPDWKATTTTNAMAPSTMERSDSESTYQDSTAKDKDDLSSMKSDKLRTSQSSTSISSNPATPLQSIIEEDRRPSQDKSALRRGSDSVGEYEPVYQKHNTLSPVAITSDSHSIYIRPLVTGSSPSAASPTINATSGGSPNRKSTSSSPERRDSSSNKIEIDSDNIETPPVVRKNLMNTDDKSNSIGSSKKLQAPRPLHQRTIDQSLANDVAGDSKGNGDLVETLGDGHFDRHSSARRTRRYRRPTDHSSGNEDRNDSSPETVPSNPIFPNLYTNLDHDHSMGNKDIIDTSPDRGDDDTLSKSKSMDILSRIGRQGRNMSSINQEAVREAIRKLKSPTETPERIWSPPREIVVTPKDRCIASKALNHAELNDEGFEETQSCQSLVSDGKDSTSSCNDAAEHTQSHTSALSPTQQSKSKSVVKSLMERNRQSLERSRSLRATSTTSSLSNSIPHSRSSIIPKRTNSLRRTIDTGTMSSNKQDVERSGSRTSLRSSRSSLNSSASINTVRNMSGLKATGAIVAQTPSTTRQLSADKASLRKKLVQQQSTPQSVAQQQSGRGTLKGSNSLNSYLRARTPASRSSSSGSSIGGPSSRQSYTKNSTSSNSITPPSISSPQRPAFRNTVSVSNSTRSTSGGSSGGAGGSGGRLNNLKGIASKTSNRVSSFMRPTTSSATKVHSSSNRNK